MMMKMMKMMKTLCRHSRRTDKGWRYEILLRRIKYLTVGYGVPYSVEKAIGR